MCMAASDAQYVLGALHDAACHLWVGSYHVCYNSATFTSTQAISCLLAKHQSGNIQYSTAPTWHSRVAQLGDIVDIRVAG